MVLIVAMHKWNHRAIETARTINPCSLMGGSCIKILDAANGKMIPKPLKPRKCKQCKETFEPKRPLQSVCSPKCAILLAEKNRAKKEKKDLREAKERIKSRSDYMREAQQVFNAYIRARDNSKGYGCISCGTKQGKENAGHYRSVGSCPALRFEEKNVHLQCEKCNTYLHGNLIQYRTALLLRIGQLNLHWLEGPHEAKKYTIEDLKAIKKEYKEKLKQLAPITKI